MKKTFLFILLGVFIALLLVRKFYFPVFTTSQVSIAESRLDIEFADARKCLVRSNAMENVIATNSGELISHQWQSGIVDFTGKLSAWHLDLQGDFSVKCEAGYFAGRILNFHDHVDITPDQIKTITTLTEPTGNLVGYTSNVIVKRQGPGTTIQNSTQIDYQGRVPRWMQEDISQQVKDSAENAVNNTNAAIQNHIKNNVGKIQLHFGAKQFQ